MKRILPTITFQPTVQNLKKLKPSRRKKMRRGELTKTINAAIAQYFFVERRVLNTPDL